MGRDGTEKAGQFRSLAHSVTLQAPGLQDGPRWDAQRSEQLPTLATCGERNEGYWACDSGRQVPKTLNSARLWLAGGCRHGAS